MAYFYSVAAILKNLTQYHLSIYDSVLQVQVSNNTIPIV